MSTKLPLAAVGDDAEGALSGLLARFLRVEESWRQEVAGQAPAPFERVDVSERPEEEQAAALEAAIDRAHRSLGLAVGPVWRVVLLEGGPRQPRLLLVIVHHLVVDGVSWRVLLEDLYTVCGQRARGGQSDRRKGAHRRHAHG